MPPKTTLWDLTAETAAKHRVLTGYLDAWLPIMGTQGGRIVLIDGFAGPGRYRDGEPGSPLLMLASLLDHAAFERISAEVVFLFIEKDSRRVAHLRSEIEALSLPPNVNVDVLEGDFREVFGPILDELEKEGQRLAETFAFIDPFGYSETDLNLTSRILGFRGCEVLIFVPLRHIARFLDAETVPAEALTNLFGDDRWREAQGLPSGPEREAALRDLLVERLLEECKYVKTFEIAPKGGYRGATLFFGTNHKRGLERMKDAMWAIDPAEGARFTDATDPSQPTLFDPEPDYADLERRLRDRFDGDEFSIEQAEHFVLVDTPYRHNAHLKTKTLARAEREDRLEATTQRKRRFSYPAGTRMRFRDPADGTS